MNWNKITTEIANEICDMYASGCAIGDIRKKYHINEIRIRKVLVDNGIEIRNPRQSMTKEGEWDYQTECLKRYPKHEGYHYIAVAKDSGIKYDDYMNTSGSLTNYIFKTYGIKPISLYKRKKKFKETGKQWYEEYFDIIEEPDQIVEYKHCPYCDWKTIDITNKSGAFLNHLLYEHDITKEQYLKEHPEDKGFLSLVQTTKQLQFEEDETKFVVCAICGKKLSRIDQKHLVKHGISIDEYQKLYTGSTVSDALHFKLSESTTELNKHLKFHNRSKAEIEIEDFIKKHGIEVNGKRKMVEGNEIDIYVPSLKFGIEYNGIFYHTEEMGKGRNYHLNKTNVCRKNGIRLLQVFEDEYKEHKDIVLNKILHIIGVSDGCERIMARKCNVVEIKTSEAKEFVNKYHIQGYSNSTVCLGAYYNNNLVGVMTFKRERKDNNTWELNRFCTDYNYICQGIGGKLFKYFVRTYDPEGVKSFADRRWTLDENNCLYTKIGFSFDGYIRPDYRYIGKTTARKGRIHKFNLRKDKMLKMDKKGLLTPDMTEDTMRKKLGYNRIWDCGLIRYIWKKKDAIK